MSQSAAAFIQHLARLDERDRGAISTLRRSQAFAPGAYPPAYPYVERFVGGDRRAEDPWRLALYTVGGLFAQHPRHVQDMTLAGAFGQVALAREAASTEHRFIALLGAEPEHLPTMLRQIVSLVASDGRGFDYVRLLEDTAKWLHPLDVNSRDRLRQRWARDFYRVLDQQAEVGSDQVADAADIGVSLT